MRTIQLSAILRKSQVRLTLLVPLIVRRFACCGQHHHADFGIVPKSRCCWCKWRRGFVGRQKLLICRLWYVTLPFLCLITAGNDNLTDLHRLLDIFRSAQRHVFVAGNDRLCIQPSLYWGTQPMSYIEYPIGDEVAELVAVFLTL